MTQQIFGELILTFTTNFQLAYNDQKSGATMDGAFWHPIAPVGFLPLGSIGVKNYSPINGTIASLCVAAAPDSNNPLVFPTDYNLIWNDKKSGATMNGSCWRPIPPTGYVALGDVFVTGYDKPPLNYVTCVRQDLTAIATLGAEIYKDTKSGATMDIDTYQICTPNSDLSNPKGFFAVNTFAANNSYSPPTDAPVINCLNLPFPVVESTEPTPPALTSTNLPASISGKTIDRIVTVPFTAIVDPAYSVQWKVANSPFYTIERQVMYVLELFNYNQTSRDQNIVKSVTTGVSQSDSETFSQSVGLSVTATTGVSFLGTGGEVSATITTELGFEQSTVYESFSEETIERSIFTAPSKAAALWALSYNLMVVRANQTILPSQLCFDVNSFVEDEFPNN